MTYRPLGARIVAYAAAVSLAVVFGAVAIELPPEIKAVFTVSQIGTLVVMFGVVLAILWGIARSMVRTGDAGVDILNGYRRHRVPWDQVVDVSLRAGAPWGTLTTTDDRELMILAIQGSDGQRARSAVWTLREQILQRRG